MVRLTRSAVIFGGETRIAARLNSNAFGLHLECDDRHNEHNRRT
jgi:hypothetical protein